MGWIRKSLRSIGSLVRRVGSLFTTGLATLRLEWFLFRHHSARQEFFVKINTYATALKVRFEALVARATWAKQLIDASQHGGRLPTLISTFFVNLLGLAFPLMLMQTYDRVIPNRTYSTLAILAVGVIFALLIESTLRIARTYVDLWSDTKYEYQLGRTAFDKIINAPLYVFEATDVGTRLKQFSVLDQIRGFYNTQLLIAIYDIPFLIIFFLVIFYIGGFLCFIPFLVALGVAYLSLRFIKRWKHLLEEKITHESKESDFIINVLTGIHTVKSLGMENLMIRRYERLQDTGIPITYQSNVQSEELSILKNISNQLVTILMTTAGSVYVINGAMGIGGLAACILLVGRIMQPLNRILTAYNRWSMLSIVRTQLDSILQLPVEDKSKVSGFTELKGEIDFKNLSFYFGDKSTYWILHNITLNIPPRTMVAIVGQKQSDKTALLNILATIVKPTTGEYLLDGNDVDQYQTYELREQIAYLGKSGKLFCGTMMENLSAFHEEYIPTAHRFAEMLGLNKIISKLPAGFDTMVGDKAVEALPGGVINLIFIVRALVSKPKIVLFDEANINLDTFFTKKIIELLTALREIATIIILSNTPGTIALADVVYCLKEGQLIQEEKHAE